MRAAESSGEHESMQDDLSRVAGVSVGDVIADKYRIERILGVGGMGIVVAAYHIHLDERVAIKFLLPEALGNPEIVARFASEARAAVKIKSEHVARVTDVGTLASGSPYMVMEYLEGCDLATRIARQGALPIEQAVEFVLQACEAIADAHGIGIVHRDLKPSNLFCIRRSDGLESIKVLDFGISKTRNDVTLSSPQLTKTSAVLGSPMYMSPEQMLSSRDVDGRTDIWSIGTILYECLTTRSPFEGETLPEVFARISSQPPQPLCERRPDTPPGLEAVVLKCLEKDRNNRYANVAELARALAPFGPKRARNSVERISRIIQASGMSVSAVELPSSSLRPTTGSRTAAAWGQTSLPERKSTSRAPMVIAAVSSSALALGALVWVLGGGKPTGSDSVPSVHTLSREPAPPEVVPGSSTSTHALESASPRDVNSAPTPSALASQVPPPSVEVAPAPALVVQRTSPHSTERISPPRNSAKRVREAETQPQNPASAVPAQPKVRDDADFLRNRR